MKNKLFGLGTIIIIAGFVLSFSGCGALPAIQTNTASLSYQNWGVFGEAAKIPIKDFESKGIVFTEASFTLTEKGEINGETFTYQALLKKARDNGGDAIINVAIDKKVGNITEGKRTTKQETWYGSALAIKYTTALTQADLNLNALRAYQTGSSASTSVEVPAK